MRDGAHLDVMPSHRFPIVGECSCMLGAPVADLSVCLRYLKIFFSTDHVLTIEVSRRDALSDIGKKLPSLGVFHEGITEFQGRRAIGPIDNAAHLAGLS
jgi:hypothetical protein